MKIKDILKNVSIVIASIVIVFLFFFFSDLIGTPKTLILTIILYGGINYCVKFIRFAKRDNM